MTDAVFYTVTMAKVYAEQGYYEQSAEIYRFLLKNDPGRPDLVAALSEVEKKLLQTNSGEITDLIPLFEEWIDLLLRYNNLQKLKKLRNRLQGSVPTKNPAPSLDINNNAD